MIFSKIDKVIAVHFSFRLMFCLVIKIIKQSQFFQMIQHLEISPNDSNLLYDEDVILMEQNRMAKAELIFDYSGY